MNDVTNSLPDFQQRQFAFTTHIRDPKKNPRPAGIEERRMKVYRDLLYNNTEGFISGAFPVLRSLYSDADWHALVRAFFADYRCQTPYFLEIAREFINYLQNHHQPRPCDPAGLLELAHYEWVELALEVSDETIDLNGIDANGDLINGHPVLSPLAWPLVYTFPVHTMGPDHLPEEAPEQATCLVVYRNRTDEVKFLEINPVTARLIGLLQENESLRGKDAIELIIAEMNHPSPGVVHDGGRQALETMQSYGIILGCSKENT